MARERKTDRYRLKKIRRAIRSPINSRNSDKSIAGIDQAALLIAEITDSAVDLEPLESLQRFPLQ